MRLRPFVIAAAPALLLAGCGDDEERQQTRAQRPEAMPTMAVDTSVPAEQASPSATPSSSPSASPSPTPSGSPSPDTRSGPIPAAFRGVWGVDPSNCGERAQLRLEVEPERLVFYESAAEVRSAEEISDLVLRLDLAFSGEGQSWRARNTLVLLDRGHRLRREAPGTEPVIYTRCPN